MRKIFLWITFLIFYTSVANANWGMGMYGGLAPCPMGPQYGEAYASIMDDIEVYNQERDKVKQKLRAKKKSLRKVQERMRRDAKDIEDVLLSWAAEVAIQHMNEGHILPSEYTNACALRFSPQGAAAQGSAGASATRVPPGSGVNPDTLSSGAPAGGQVPSAAGFCVPCQEIRANLPAGQTKDGAERDGFCDFWSRRFARANGRVDPEICAENEEFTKYKLREESRKRGYCKDSLASYAEEAQEARRLEAEIAAYESELDRLARDKRDAKREAEREKEEYEDSIAEGEYCETCERSRYGYYKPSTGERIAGFLGSLLGAGLGYYTTTKVADINARAGWPSSPVLALGGANAVFQGVYGAMYSGLGAGFSCIPSHLGPYGALGAGGFYGGPYGGAGGAFGYPGSFYGGAMGGGLYMPGMGPWGMAGPWGGMGFPGMGMVMAGGMMIGGGGYPMMGAIGGGGAIGGYPMGIPIGGYPVAGVAMMGGMAMGGYPMMGAMGGGMAMGGYPMMGAMGGGMAMGGYPMMGGTPPFMPGGYPMMGGAIGGNAQMQYMQQYMQQMQQYMAFQQQQQQDYMQRIQVITELQNELYRIQSQIQQISQGMYFGGGAAIGGGIGVGGGGPTTGRGSGSGSGPSSSYGR